MKKINLIFKLSEEEAKLFSKIGVKVSLLAIEIPDGVPLYFQEVRDGTFLQYYLVCDDGWSPGFYFLSLSDKHTPLHQYVGLDEGIIASLLKHMRELERIQLRDKTETVGDEKISTIGGKKTDPKIQILVDKKISNKTETIGGKKTDAEREKEKDLEPVTAKLNVFKAKEATFRQEASKQKNNKQQLKYNEAAQAVKKIGNALDLLISEYTRSNQNLDSFKDATQQMLASTDIKQDIKTLASHRGTKLLLLNILSAIITLGGSLIYGAAKGNYSLFRAPTDSNSKLQKVTEAIEKLPKKS